MLMTSSKQGKHLLIKVQLFHSNVVLVLNVSAMFEWDQIKDEEAAPILRLFSAVIDTQQNKDDVIMDLTIAAFKRFYLRELPCQVWW